MTWVLQKRGKESWFREWMPIGPRFTDKIEEAVKFDTKEAALRSPAWSFSLTPVDAVKLKQPKRKGMGTGSVTTVCKTAHPNKRAWTCRKPKGHNGPHALESVRWSQSTQPRRKNHESSVNSSNPKNIGGGRLH